MQRSLKAGECFKSELGSSLNEYLYMNAWRVTIVNNQRILYLKRPLKVHLFSLKKAGYDLTNHQAAILWPIKLQKEKHTRIRVQCRHITYFKIIMCTVNKMQNCFMSMSIDHVIISMHVHNTYICAVCLQGSYSFNKSPNSFLKHSLQTFMDLYVTFQ